MKKQFLNLEHLYHMIKKLRGQPVVTDRIIFQPGPPGPPGPPGGGGGGGGGGGFPYIWLDGVIIYFVNPLIAGQIRINCSDSNGGIVISAGQTATAPSAGQVLLEGTVTVPSPVNDTDAVRKAYADDLLGNLVRWEASPPLLLDISNQTSTITWTDLDVTDEIITGTLLLILQLNLVTSVIGGGAIANVRKNGTTGSGVGDIYILPNNGDTNGAEQVHQVMVQQDSNGIIEYQLEVGAGATVDFQIRLLGCLVDYSGYL